MRAIIVDDEPLMLGKFLRLSSDIPDLNIVGQFETGAQALVYAKDHMFEAAFLDVAMPNLNGVEVAKALKQIYPEILIVFISAYEDYLWDFNQIGGDYYIIKPYTRETLEMMMEKLRLLLRRQQKPVYIQTFGRFLVFHNGQPMALTGKSKEILALTVTRRGKEISNEEIYRTIWEDRPYGNVEMTVYYNALRRLKWALKKAGLDALLISTQRGQLINTEMFDCDYYAWQDKNMEERDRFEGEFLSEYSWGEYLLAEMMNENE